MANPTGKGGFQKGRSGNPGGRPRVLGDLRELARQHTRDAVLALVEIMHSGRSEPARVAAASAILDRGWGKPAQPQTGEGGEGPVRLEIVWAGSSGS